MKKTIILVALSVSVFFSGCEKRHSTPPKEINSTKHNINEYLHK
ncbi:MAG: hypothetical protein PHE67_04625 [Campylobacterales bacterium]|nr:hypothetical protein [Campylobacterales bacterium]